MFKKSEQKAHIFQCTKRRIFAPKVELFAPPTKFWEERDCYIALAHPHTADTMTLSTPSFEQNVFDKFETHQHPFNIKLGIAYSKFAREKIGCNHSFAMSLAAQEKNIKRLEHLFKENRISFHEAGEVLLVPHEAEIPSIVIDDTEDIIKAIDLLNEFDFFESAQVLDSRKTRTVNLIIEDFRSAVLKSHIHKNHILFNLYQKSKKEINLLLEGVIQKQCKFSLVPGEIIVVIAKNIVQNHLQRNLTKNEEAEITKYTLKKLQATLISFGMFSLSRQIFGSNSLISSSYLPIEITRNILLSYLISSIKSFNLFSDYQWFIREEIIPHIDSFLKESSIIIQNHREKESLIEVQIGAGTDRDPQAMWNSLENDLDMFIHEAVLGDTDHSLGVNSPRIILSNIIEAIIKSDDPLTIIKNDTPMPENVRQEVTYFLGKNAWFMDKEIMGTDWLLAHISELRSRQHTCEAKKQLSVVKLQLENMLPKKEEVITTFFNNWYENQNNGASVLYAVLNGKKSESSLNKFRGELLNEPLKSIYKQCKDHELIAPSRQQSTSSIFKIFS